jgi:hypothetical protein
LLQPQPPPFLVGSCVLPHFIPGGNGLIRVAAPVEKVNVKFDDTGGWTSNISGMMVPVLTATEQVMGVAELKA